MTIFLHEFSAFNIPILMGIFASVFHVWTGPDHLAAVTPLVFNSNKDHWKIGASWGIGHLIGMILIGVLFYFFKDYIPVDSISKYSEQIVGIILIGMGIWSFYRMKFEHKHSHSHPHTHSEGFQDFVHVHEHQHFSSPHNHQHTIKENQNSWAAMSVGVIHGFAGISHFLLMLPALAFHTQWESGQYLIGFAIGTVTAMVFFSFIIGKFHRFNPTYHNHNVFSNLRFWGGIVAVSVGVFWIIKNFV